MNTWWLLYSLIGVVWFIGNAIVIIMQRRPAASTILFGEAENRLLADSFERDLIDSRELVAEDLAAQSFGQRLGQSAARLLSPLL